MTKHQELAKEIADELYQDKNVLALILYGSVSRNEESPNSDIDLLAIIKENHLQKRHVVRYGITIEFVEMSINFLQDFIAKKEIPMLFALANGIVLFNKIPDTEKLISDARKIIEEGPPINPNWKDERYVTKKRSDLTEIYYDLLDVEDVVVFHYLVSLLIANAIPWLIENYNLWPQTRKKTIGCLKSQCAEGYKYIETLLTPGCSLPEKREAAKNLINYTMKQHGGILEGDTIIFSRDST
ncbi:MAG TPA: nucleotidyltransferase domain-containing protein [Clostridiales bacterium]|nr:nucleotidyltransferase domain-containing protein [Clostridiales bacterium]HPV01981.1 nucleotidyltransferase domain-containing protein [Clostridiales bacterium]